MNGLIEQMASLGFDMPNELYIDLILQSLPNSYAQFIMKFNISGAEKTIPELINLLKTVDPTVNKINKSLCWWTLLSLAL